MLSAVAGSFSQVVFASHETGIRGEKGEASCLRSNSHGIPSPTRPWVIRRGQGNISPSAYPVLPCSQNPSGGSLGLYHVGVATLLRPEALTPADMLLCAEAAARWKVAEEHCRRRLLVSTSALLRHPFLGFRTYIMLFQCPWSPGELQSRSSPLLWVSLLSFGVRDSNGVGQRGLELGRNLRDDLVLGMFTRRAPVSAVEA